MNELATLSPATPVVIAGGEFHAIDPDGWGAVAECGSKWRVRVILPLGEVAAEGAEVCEDCFR